MPSLPKEDGETKIKGKFEYEIDFDEEEQELEKSGKRKKHVPRVKADRKVEYCTFCPEN